MRHFLGGEDEVQSHVSNELMKKKKHTLVKWRLDLDTLENLGHLLHDRGVLLQRRVHVPDLENIRVPACGHGQSKDLVIYYMGSKAEVRPRLDALSSSTNGVCFEFGLQCVVQMALSTTPPRSQELRTQRVVALIIFS